MSIRFTCRGSVLPFPSPQTRQKSARDQRTPTEKGTRIGFMSVKTKTLCFTCTAKSVCIESDIVHDYAEIYTPSREKLPWDKPSVNNNNNKPPTPPLHRFPSWESRIYQVANEGLAGVAAVANQAEPTAVAVHPSRVVSSQGYCDISVPVYATVKGVSFYRIFSSIAERGFGYCSLGILFWYDKISCETLGNMHNNKA